MNKQEDCSCTDECLGYLTKSCKRIEEPKQETTSEGFHRISKEFDYSEFDFVSFKIGAEWKQEQFGKSEFLQKLRATLSDAEARRLINEQFKKEIRYENNQRQMGK